MKSQYERVYPNTFTVAPVAVLDAPMRGKGFEKLDEEGNSLGLMTIREKCATSGARYQLSNDGRYFMFGWELSDLANDLAKAKAFATENGMQLGGADFTQTGDGLVWFLTPSERNEFLGVNPMFKTDEQTQ